MVSKEQIVEDSRFFIDEFNLNRIYNEKLQSYSVEKISVGRILRQYGKKIMPLYETDVYKFLSQSEKSIVAYRQYCDNIGMERRSIANYNSLIEQIKADGYDILKGAIFINQHNLILEGQHRSCILLQQYGPSYCIDVVRFVYSERFFRPRFWARLLLAKMKNFVYNSKR